MTDPQILTLAIAVIVPLSLLIYSNSRITDAKETLRAEMHTLRIEMNARFDKLEAKLDTKMDALTEHLEMRFKLHELEHHGKKP
jgi:hypothetical protein